MKLWKPASAVLLLGAASLLTAQTVLHPQLTYSQCGYGGTGHIACSYVLYDSNTGAEVMAAGVYFNLYSSPGVELQNYNNPPYTPGFVVADTVNNYVPADIVWTSAPDGSIILSYTTQPNNQFPSGMKAVVIFANEYIWRTCGRNCRRQSLVLTVTSGTTYTAIQ